MRIEVKKMAGSRSSWSPEMIVQHDARIAATHRRKAAAFVILDHLLLGEQDKALQLVEEYRVHTEVKPVVQHV